MRVGMAVLEMVALATGLSALTISDVRRSLESTYGKLQTFQADVDWLEIQPGSC